MQKGLLCPSLGLARYHGVRAGLDELVANDHLELLLNSRSGAIPAAGDPGMSLT